jgi:signal transduction histidine kinase
LVQIESGEMVTLSRLIERIPENEFSRGLRSPHAWIIIICFIVLTFLYYIDQTTLVDRPYFDNSVLTGVHDLHRTLFLIPIVHAGLVYKVRGSLIVSLAFLCAVLPRALSLSPYPNPLSRALISVTSSAIIGVLVALWVGRFQKERKAKANLAAAYESLRDYDRRLQENQDMLIQAERLASMGQLAASIAHEVNNPLSGVLVYVQLLAKKIARDDPDKNSLLNYLSKIDLEIKRSAKLIRNLLDFSSQSEPSMKEVDVNEVLNRAADLAVPARLGNTRVVKVLTLLSNVLADPDQLQQVFINLIMNAFQAMPSGGTLTLLAYEAAGEARIAVKDTGCGIPAENMCKLFTPFFSTKKEVKGVGLGLCVSYGIIERFKGRIDVESRVGEGSIFTVCLPLPRSESGKSTSGSQTVPT